MRVRPYIVCVAVKPRPRYTRISIRIIRVILLWFVYAEYRFKRVHTYTWCSAIILTMLCIYFSTVLRRTRRTIAYHFSFNLERHALSYCHIL